jgi:signal transduction histidine kinase
MAEQKTAPELQLETLAVYQALEGLIHNINTPLNVILGYSQQLRKQHPEISGLEDITKAGLQIDDLVQSMSGQLAQRFFLEPDSFGLVAWLQNEIKLLRNILRIKHSLHFDLTLPETETEVYAPAYALGMVLESLVLFICRYPEVKSGNNRIGIELKQSETSVAIYLILPVSDEISKDLETYIDILTARINADFTDCIGEGKHIGIEYNGSNGIIINLNKQR